MVLYRVYKLARYNYVGVNELKKYVISGKLTAGDDAGGVA